MDDAVFVLAVLGVSLGGIIAITGIITAQVRAIRESAYNARLKQMMIERGFSADEIERVLKADPQTAAEREKWKGMAEFMHGRKAC